MRDGRAVPLWPFPCLRDYEECVARLYVLRGREDDLIVLDMKYDTSLEAVWDTILSKLAFQGRFDGYVVEIREADGRPSQDEGGPRSYRVAEFVERKLAQLVRD